MYNKWKYQLEQSNLLVKLIVINAVVFLGIHLIYIPLKLAGVDGLHIPDGKTYTAVYWLSIPANLKLLLLRPWSVITHMFVHQEFWHIVFNMLMLYFSGRIFADLLNDRRLLPTYIFGGLAGMLFFITGYNLLPALYHQQGAFAIGASASVMAVFVATATYFPTYQVYLFGVFKMPLWLLAVLYVAADFIALGGSSNLGGHLAHLGGAAYGFFYARQLGSGVDWSQYFYGFFNVFKRLFSRQNLKVGHRNSASSQRSEKRSDSRSRQKTIDEILDKISRSGYESLNKEEKETLFKASKDQ